MAPRPLLLVGGGGLAREVLATVRLLPEKWNPIGALDDDPSRHGTDLDGVVVLGGSDFGGFTDAAVVACVANARRPASRLGVIRRLDLPDDRWATVVHPAACVPEGSILGPGTVLLAGAVVTSPLRIGAHVVAMPHVLITHDDKIADGATFAGGRRSAVVSVWASVRISARVRRCGSCLRSGRPRSSAWDLWCSKTSLRGKFGPVCRREEFEGRSVRGPTGLVDRYQLRSFVQIVLYSTSGRHLGPDPPRF